MGGVCFRKHTCKHSRRQPVRIRPRHPDATLFASLSPDKLTAGKDRPPGLAIPAVIWGSRSAADHLHPESVRWFRGRRASAVRIRPAPPMPKPGLALRLGFTLPRGLHRDRAISSTFFLTAGKDRPVAGGIPLPAAQADVRS